MKDYDGLARRVYKTLVRYGSWDRLRLRFVELFGRTHFLPNRFFLFPIVLGLFLSSDDSVGPYLLI